MKPYHGFNVQDEIDREYNAVLMVPDLQPYFTVPIYQAPGFNVMLCLLL
jgi:hypothetical protein